jgi:hypothetical protein
VLAIVVGSATVGVKEAEQTARKRFERYRAEVLEALNRPGEGQEERSA